MRQQPSYRDLVTAAYYDDPLVDAAERYRNSNEWETIRSLLPNVKHTALDVGAGRGIASYALAHEGFQVSALEPDASELVGASAIRSLAKMQDLPITVAQEFSEQLPFPDKKFDLVFARAVLHHLTDMHSACREFFRVLKPGGKFIAVREHVISRPEDLELFLNIHPLHHLYGGENAFLLEDYITPISEAGLEIQQVISPLESPINFAPHTLQTLKKEIAKKATKNLPFARDIVRFGLGIPPVWSITEYLLGKVDHRPGRHYSFIANRPE
ncbi:MAG: methyltransferase domain-containing protein [Pseudomonadota bacterium]|nr:methyltransferase domain-containing protein [Pseudomonadota bacterium]